MFNFKHKKRKRKKQKHYHLRNNIIKRSNVKKKIIILSLKHLENFCNYLKTQIEKNDIECIIQHTKLKNKTNDIIFVISHSLLTFLPKNFYFFQIEQLNKISKNTAYYKTLTILIKKSIQTFDYSKTNMKYYPENIHIEHFLFNFSSKIPPLEKIYDVLFFGSINSGINKDISIRRKKILQKLSHKFKIYFPRPSVYGKELTKIINQSKIMLNLHFYDNAILETARLQEGVGLNTHIISEYPCEEDMEAIEPYKDRVEFVEIIKDDLSNIHLLEEKIEELLKGEKEVPVWENKIVDNTYSLIENIRKNKPKKIYFLNQNKAGGSYIFTNMLINKINKCDKYFKIEFILNKKNLESLNSNDILFIQYLFHTNINPYDIIKIKKEKNCKMIISLHDFYWFRKNLHINDNFTHSSYLLQNIKINNDILKLFSLCDYILCPSYFVLNEYKNYFYNCNFVNIPRFDYKINYDNYWYKKVEDSLNIGVIHKISIYKGKKYYNMIKKIKSIIFNGQEININLIPIKYNLYDVFTKLTDIHCLSFFNFWGETYNQSLSKGIMSGLPIIFNSIGASTERLLDDNNYPLQERFFEIKKFTEFNIKQKLHEILTFLKSKKKEKNIDISPNIIFKYDWFKIFYDNTLKKTNKKINKVAICLFGILRNKSFFTNFNETIIENLKKAGIEYDIYIHTYTENTLNFIRTNEFGFVDIKINNKINYKNIIFEKQKDFDKKSKELYENVKKYGDIYNNNFESLINLIRQLNSIKKVTSLWSDIEKYDLYLYMRLDVIYHDKIDINFISKYLDQKVIFTPYWHKCYGLNDRFAAGDYDTMKIYGNKLDEIFNYMNNNIKKSRYYKKKCSLHGERLVKFIVEKYNLKNIDLDFKFSRLRFKGNIVNENFNIIHYNVFK